MVPLGGYTDKAVSKEALPVQALMQVGELSLDYCKQKASFLVLYLDFLTLFKHLST